MNLTKKQKSAIIGMILGDAFLQKTGKKNARLRLEHRASHRDYLIWKMKIVPLLFQGKSVFLKRIHPVTKKMYYYVRHQSNSSPILGKLRKIFYPKGKKIIPSKLSQLLKEKIGLAIWYFDDGYYYQREKSSYLYLGRVSRQEAEIASNTIFNNFGLINRIRDKKNKGFVLYFSPTETKKLKRLIQEYTIPVMKYKLPS